MVNNVDIPIKPLGYGLDNHQGCAMDIYLNNVIK